MTDDPLSSLLVDADEVDRAALARALSGVLGIDNKSGRVVLLAGFRELDTRRRALSFLLGAKVAMLLGLREGDGVTPKEMETATGMPHGTVSPKLSQLFEQRLASKTKSGAYFVASHQVPSAVQELGKVGGNGEAR